MFKMKNTYYFKMSALLVKFLSLGRFGLSTVCIKSARNYFKSVKIWNSRNANQTIN